MSRVDDVSEQMCRCDQRPIKSPYQGSHYRGSAARQNEVGLTARAAASCRGTWIKVALTPEQVARNSRLRALTIDKVDNHYRPPRPYRAVDCEALGQAVLERMLRGTRSVAARAAGARTSTRAAAAGQGARGAEEVAMTITTAVLLVRVTGTVLWRLLSRPARWWR
jgi:hypothetical protein